MESEFCLPDRVKLLDFNKFVIPRQTFLLRNAAIISLFIKLFS